MGDGVLTTFVVNYAALTFLLSPVFKFLFFVILMNCQKVLHLASLSRQRVDEVAGETYMHTYFLAWEFDPQDRSDDSRCTPRS